MLMLATELKTLSDIPQGRTMVIQQKLDGARYQLFLYKDGRIELKGRNNNTLKNDIYPEIIKEAKELWSGISEDLILDGEIIVGDKQGDFWYNNNFSLLQSREHTQNKFRINLLVKLAPVRFIIFDFISEASKIASMPLEERLQTLTGFMNGRDNKRICIIPSQVGKQSKAYMLFEEAKRLGFEGIILKDPLSVYQDGRSTAWYKLKTYVEEDVKAIGYTSKNREISSLITDKGKVNFTGQPDIIAQKILKMDISIIKENTDEMQYYFIKDFVVKVKYLPSEYEVMRFPILKEVMI